LPAICGRDSCARRRRQEWASAAQGIVDGFTVTITVDSTVTITVDSTVAPA